MKLCNQWIELENEKEGLYEYCKGTMKKCTCAGVKNQCNYPKHFKSVYIKTEKE